MLMMLAILSLIAGSALLLILSIIDLKTWLLPNEYVLGLFIMGLLFHWSTGFAFLNIIDMAIGAAVGAGLLYFIRFAAEKFYQEDALGLGDVKLMGAAGVWLGPYYILTALIIGALAGIVHGLGLALYKTLKHKTPFNLTRLSLPAGPGFAIGIFLTALYVFRAFPAMVFS